MNNNQWIQYCLNVNDQKVKKDIQKVSELQFS